MKFCSNSVIKRRSNVEAEILASPAAFLLTTKQFLEAYASGYEDFELKDLYLAAARILKIQMYQLYRLVKTSHALKHKLKTSFISQSFYDVTPANFEASNDEIELYIKNPRVIFRYSTLNHDAICSIFEVPKLRNAFTIKVKTYNHDFSQIMPYLKAKHLTSSKKSLFKNKHKTSDQIDLNYVKDTFKKYFKYQMKDHECIEYLYSDDFHIHRLHAATTYMDFVCAILTGNYEVCINGEKEEFFTGLADDLTGAKESQSKLLKSIANEPAAIKAYKIEMKQKKLEESKQKKLDKKVTTLSRKQYKAEYKAQIEAERTFKKFKKSGSSDDVPKNSFGQILRSGFDSISSNSLGRIARKNALLNRGVSIASNTVDTIHRQAMRGVEKSLRLKRKTSIVFGDETEKEVNAEFEDQSFLRSYIEEGPQSIFIRNGIDSESIVPEFEMKDYVGTQVYPDGHSIVEHLTSYADNGRKRTIHCHPLAETNNWLYSGLMKEPLGFYPFILKLLGESCKAENTEVECNYGALTMRTPWILPVPQHRIDFIKKSYTALVPSVYWNRLATFDFGPSVSTKKDVKIAAAVDAWIVDYRKVFDDVDDAYELQKAEKYLKRKARLANIEAEKEKRLAEEQLKIDNNEAVNREIDHVIVDDLEASEEKEIANEYVNQQFNGLFNEVTHCEQSTLKISKHLINERIRKLGDGEEFDEHNSLNVQYDSDIEKENLSTKEILDVTIIEKKINQNLLLKEQCGTIQKGTVCKIKNTKRLRSNVAQTSNLKPRWFRKVTTLDPKRIDFDLSGVRYLPKLYLSSHKESHPKFRRYNKELHKTFKRNAIIDYSPFITRPEMTWCILSGSKNQHVIDNYIQAMQDRFSSIYVSLMTNINNSNVDFTYDDKQSIRQQIELRNKTSPIFCDFRIIPFTFGEFVYNENFIIFVACFLTSFFVKHNSDAVLNPESYRDQVMDSMKSSKKDALAIFIYAKDCHLYELYFANTYLKYAEKHINSDNEFKGNLDRVGCFNLFNFAFDELYVPYYRILDSSFNEVFDSYLGHYKKCIDSRDSPIDRAWFRHCKYPDDATDKATKFGNYRTLDVIGYENSFNYSKDLKNWLSSPIF